MSSKRGISSSTNRGAVDSAALQADIARRLNLPGGSSSSSKRKTTSKDLKSSDSKVSETKKQCGSCGNCTKSAVSVCEYCGYFLSGVRAAPLSLAQMRGLAAAPVEQETLTSDDWHSVESKLDSRGDAFCPICMEGFNKGHEVLLSCSHMFHRTCLQSFEKFMKATERMCPICRTANYQKKITIKGSKAFEVVCSTKIQALWRGYMRRKVFYDIKKAFYKDGNGDLSLRTRFYEQEFSLISERMSKDIDSRDTEVNDMISASNHTLLESRQLDVLFESMLLSRLETRRLLPAEVVSPQSVHNKRNFSVNEEDWKASLHKAIHRGLDDCAICYGKLSSAYDDESKAAGKVSDSSPNVFASPSSSRIGGSLKGARRAVLLSCSHAFHSACINNFESFAVDNSLACPVCRCHYKKRILAYDCLSFGDHSVIQNRFPVESKGDMK